MSSDRTSDDRTNQTSINRMTGHCKDYLHVSFRDIIRNSDEFLLATYFVKLVCCFSLYCWGKTVQQSGLQ